MFVSASNFEDVLGQPCAAFPNNRCAPDRQIIDTPSVWRQQPAQSAGRVKLDEHEDYESGEDACGGYCSVL
jgi:hypothetical protein